MGIEKESLDFFVPTHLRISSYGGLMWDGDSYCLLFSFISYSFLWLYNHILRLRLLLVLYFVLLIALSLLRLFYSTSLFLCYHFDSFQQLILFILQQGF